MFQAFYQWIRSARQKEEKKRGQIAVVLIFLAGVLLIFFAIALNLGRISQTKTMITIASNQAAAFMASELASYAESMYQHGGGENKYGDDLTFCKWTGWVATVFAFIVLAIVTVATMGTGTAVVASIIIAGVLTIGASVMQATILEPGFSDQWNKIYRAIDLSIVDEFLERGIMTGMQSAISDTGRIYDKIDLDMDGLYYDEDFAGADDDKVGRFGIYYYNRLKRLTGLGPGYADIVTTNQIKDFQEALKAFLYKGTLNGSGIYDESDPANYWGIWDHVGWEGDGGLTGIEHYCSDDGDDTNDHPCCHEDTRTGECNCCCLPVAWRKDGLDLEGEWAWGGNEDFYDMPDNNGDGLADVPNIRAKCCKPIFGEGVTQEGDCGSAQAPACPPETTTDASGGVFDYPNFNYDPYYENRLNDVYPGYCGFQRGDVNMSGGIDIADVVLLGQYIAGTNFLQYPQLGDYNNDGLIDTTDANDMVACCFGGGPCLNIPWGPECDRAKYFRSFREFMGRDDGARKYTTNPPGDFSTTQLRDTADQDANEDGIFNEYFFRKQDARGVFKTFWKITHKVTLLFEDALGALQGIPELCQYCSYSAVPALSGETCSLAEAGLPQGDMLTCEYDNFLDYQNGKSPDYSGCCITQEEIDSFPNIPNMLIPRTQCASEAAHDGTGWWKEGVDDYCSNTWPYNENCPGKHCAATCADPCSPMDAPDPSIGDECRTGNSDEDTGSGFHEAASCENGRTPPEMWPEDEVDELRDQIDEFIGWAYHAASASPQSIMRTFSSWYGEANEWLDNTDCDQSDAPGRLCQWQRKLNDWSDFLEAWIATNTYTGKEETTLCYPTSSGAHTLNDILDTCLVNQIADYTNRLNEASTCFTSCSNGDNPPNCASTATPADFIPPVNPDISCVQQTDNYLDLIAYVRDHLQSKLTKLESRRDFLTETRAETTEVILEFRKAANQINSFLTSTAVDKLRKAHFDLTDTNQTDDVMKKLPLKPWIIYAWEDKNDKWHLVKSEGRIPGKCGGRCSRNAGISEPTWPWIKTYTKSWGTRRCYTLGDSFDYGGTGCRDGKYHKKTSAKKCFQGGRVKSRIIRYDEDKDLELKFINNVPLWRFLFHHPERNPAPDELILKMENACDIDGENAFMISGLDGDKSNNERCYYYAERLLERGMKSDTCADYFFRQYPAGSRGFALKFSACDPDPMP